MQDKAAEHEEKARQHARNLSQQVFALRRSEQMLRAELEQTQRQKLEIERVFNIEMSAMDAKLGQATSASAQHLHEVTALQRKNNVSQGWRLCSRGSYRPTVLLFRTCRNS